MTTASQTTVDVEECSTIAFTTHPASTGVATAVTAITTLSTRKAVSGRRCGRANLPMRRSVALEKGLLSRACMAWCSDVHAVTSMSMGSPVIVSLEQQAWDLKEG